MEEDFELDLSSLSFLEPTKMFFKDKKPYYYWVCAVGLYYFDLETYTKDERPDPNSDNIISVQYQPLDESGLALDKLSIIKGWEIGEKRLVETCKDLIRPWLFIPVGVHLQYDFLVIRNKLRQYGYYEENGTRFKWLICELPFIDLKHFLLLANKCRFKGHTEILNKNGENANIKNYYENKEYEKIEDYILREAENTIDIFQKMLKVAPQIKEI